MSVTFNALVGKPIIRRTENGWNAHSHHVKQFLGIKGKLPAEGMPWQVVQGVKVRVLSLELARRLGWRHRVICECPQCGKHLSVGRLHQHIVSCNKE